MTRGDDQSQQAALEPRGSGAPPPTRRQLSRVQQVGEASAAANLPGSPSPTQPRRPSSTASDVIGLNPGAAFFEGLRLSPRLDSAGNNTAYLGKGTHGSVWLVEGGIRNSRLALKLLLQSDQDCKAWEREVQHQFKLSSHLLVVSLAGAQVVSATELRSWVESLAVVLSDGTKVDSELKTKMHKELDGHSGKVLCILMEVCEGDMSGPNVDEDLRAPLYVQLVLSLSHLHQESLVHRDLKLQNLMRKKGLVMLADFGLCKRLEPGKLVNNSQTQIGTTPYQAPEIKSRVNRLPPTLRAHDIWALGVCMLASYGGVRPLDLESAAMDFADHGNANSYLTTRIPAVPLAIIRKCLVNDPKERATAQQVIAAAIHVSCMP